MEIILNPVAINSYLTFYKTHGNHNNNIYIYIYIIMKIIIIYLMLYYLSY